MRGDNMGRTIAGILFLAGLASGTILGGATTYALVGNPIRIEVDLQIPDTFTINGIPEDVTIRGGVDLSQPGLTN